MYLDILQNGMYVVGGTVVKEDAFDIDYGDIASAWTDITTTYAPNHYAANWTGLAMSANGLYQTAVSTATGPVADYIYVSTDCGATWIKQTGAGAYYFSDVAMSADGMIQTATANLAGAGYIYTSNDYGATWTQRGTDIGWTAIDMSATGQLQTAVTANGVPWISSNYGVTWAAQSTTAQNWTDVAMTSDGKMQLASAVGNIWTSTNYGVTWIEHTTGFPFNLGTRNWQNVGMSSDGKTQFIADDTSGASYPLDITLYVSNDYGTTWSEQLSSSNNTWGNVCISKDGKIILAAVNSGALWYSTNYGNGWTTVAFTNQNWVVVAISSDGRVLAAGIDGFGLARSLSDLKTYGNFDIHGRVSISNETVTPNDGIRKSVGNRTADTGTWTEDVTDTPIELVGKGSLTNTGTIIVLNELTVPSGYANRIWIGKIWISAICPTGTYRYAYGNFELRGWGSGSDHNTDQLIDKEYEVVNVSTIYNNANTINVYVVSNPTGTKSSSIAIENQLGDIAYIYYRFEGCLHTQDI
jgi:hypothetical protein